MAGAGREPGADSVKVDVFDVVVELETVTAAVPEKAESATDNVATNCAALTNRVWRGEPFQFTVSPFT